MHDQDTKIVDAARVLAAAEKAGASREAVLLAADLILETREEALQKLKMESSARIDRRTRSGCAEGTRDHLNTTAQ